MDKALILTVGMSVDPEVFAVQQLQPAYVAFVCTKQSRKMLDAIASECNLGPSSCHIFELQDDPGEIGALVAKSHEAYRWARDKVGEAGEIIVNPTAGRKWMSTGMTLFASQTKARIVYVDVGYQDGKPDRASMRIVDLGNPDDALGMARAIGPATLFNRGDYEGAAEGLAGIRPSLAAPQNLYGSLAKISGQLAKWDRFEHYQSDKVATVLKAAARDAGAAAGELDMANLKSWAEGIQNLAERIASVQKATKPALEAVADLLANAYRKYKQGRYEDAGARLYRALEATAQWMLHQDGVNASNVDWSQVSEQARSAFCASWRNNNPPLPKKLGLTDSFLLARAMGCKGADRFFDERRFVFESHIEVRNQSILAHGWTPAQKEKVDRFYEAISERVKQLGADLDGWNVPDLPGLWQ